MAAAVTAYAPGVPFAVNAGDVATPEAFVATVTNVTPPENVPLAPKPGAEKVTFTPLTGLPPASLTVATRGAAKAALTVVLCPPPLVAVIEAGEPALLVSEKTAGLDTPLTFELTWYGPAIPFAVNVGAAAQPDASVITVAVSTPPGKVPLGPLDGAVYVTLTPLSTLLCESLTVEVNCVAKAVLMVALCGVPAVATIEAGVPARLDSGNVAAVNTPETVAFTL